MWSNGDKSKTLSPEQDFEEIISKNQVHRNLIC